MKFLTLLVGPLLAAFIHAQPPTGPPGGLPPTGPPGGLPPTGPPGGLPPTGPPGGLPPTGPPGGLPPTGPPGGLPPTGPPGGLPPTGPPGGLPPTGPPSAPAPTPKPPSTPVPTCPIPLIPREQCRPSYTTTEPECRDRIRRCYISYGIELKWTGTGSPHINGHAQGDGGCQCKEYCGYYTKGPCNRDHKCIWATAKGVCFHRHPNYPGHPIDPCPCTSKCCGAGRRLLAEHLTDEEQMQLDFPEEDNEGTN